MKIVLLFCMIFGTCSVQKKLPISEKKPNKLYQVSGTISQKSSYCGGARPTKAILAKYKDPKPLPHYKVFVKQGVHNDLKSAWIDSTLTNELGVFSFSLPAGDYVLVSEAQLSRSKLDAVINKKNLKVTDQSCLNEWIEKGMVHFAVKDKDITGLDHLIYKKCNIPDGIPCLKYIGLIRP